MPMSILVLVTAISAPPTCAGASQIDLITLTSIGGLLALVISLAGIAASVGAGALGALLAGRTESAGGV